MFESCATAVMVNMHDRNTVPMPIRPVILPVDAMPSHPTRSRHETIWEPRCFTRRPGDALHPAREPLAVLQNIRRTIAEYNFAGQYQQSPAPLGGGLVKAGWFKHYRENERPERFEHRAELGHRQQSHRAQRF